MMGMALDQQLGLELVQWLDEVLELVKESLKDKELGQWLVLVLVLEWGVGKVSELEEVKVSELVVKLVEKLAIELDVASGVELDVG